LPFGKKGAPGAAALFIPSLVNKSYILDLSAKKSLMRWLAAQGLHPFLLDWGMPGPQERREGLDARIAGDAGAAIGFLRALTGRPVIVVGYCMGGLLALAAAALQGPEAVHAYAALATPWDFHADPPLSTPRLASMAALFEPWIASCGEAPIDLLQAFFAMIDPALALRKFMRFAALDPAGEAALEFVALEDWLNDGQPLAAPIARTCLADWYGANAPARGTWRVAGRLIEPQRLAANSLVIIPARDRIVPPPSALALATALPQAEIIRPPLGHIGMIVSTQAPDLVWTPLCRWLRRQGG
jgi:polyhydroxyalkanoate synthase subunit PhaC